MSVDGDAAVVAVAKEQDTVGDLGSRQGEGPRQGEGQRIGGPWKAIGQLVLGKARIKVSSTCPQGAIRGSLGAIRGASGGHQEGVPAL